MKVVCLDGTVIEADGFQPKDAGLSLTASPEGSPETIGFVPYDRLQYVVPDDVRIEFENEP